MDDSSETPLDAEVAQPPKISQLKDVTWEELDFEARDYLRGLARGVITEECVFAFGINAVRSVGEDGGFILERMNGAVRKAMKFLDITNSNAAYLLLRIATREVLQTSWIF